MLISAWGTNGPPLYLPCSTDNCLQNSQNAVCVSASIYSKVPKTKSCLFVDIWVQTFAVKYYLGGKNFVINCVYILVFFTVGSYWPHGTVNVTFFHGTRAGSNQNDIKRFIYIIFLRNRPVYANSWSCTQKKIDWKARRAWHGSVITCLRDGHHVWLRDSHHSHWLSVSQLLRDLEKMHHVFTVVSFLKACP